ncbi:hypothetical protein EH223_06610 [candidate division KSB1 bacterium]|nr:NYN domain-containing protein [candidate division KSB1 bacterium]RQW04823.1 MAG: hypothetical protein EH223_06610 [candidate division KSB1 bacterium]
MSMRNRPQIIIDGYNYILRQDRIDFDQEYALWDAREKLIHQMIAYLGQKQLRITIVFDGQDLKGITKIRRPAGLSVLFSHAPQKADPLIIKMVQKAKNPGSITVVSSDANLVNTVKAYGCIVTSSEDFSTRIAADHREIEFINKYDAQLTPKEVEEWMRIFRENERKD